MITCIPTENVKFKEEPLDVSLAFKEKFTTHGLCWVFNADGLRNVNRTGGARV